jgi:hypothetical protein
MKLKMFEEIPVIFVKKLPYFSAYKRIIFFKIGVKKEGALIRQKSKHYLHKQVFCLTKKSEVQKSKRALSLLYAKGFNTPKNTVLVA